MFSLLLLILVTSREVLWFRPLVGLSAYNYALALIFGFVLIVNGAKFLSRSSYSENAFPLGHHFRKRYYSIAALACCTIVFLILHEFLIGDRMRALKHAFYFSLLIVLPFSNLKAISRVWVGSAAVVSVAMILQALLVFFFHGNSLDAFDYLPIETIEDRTDQRYTFPFFMGFVRTEDLVEYGDFSFFRMSGISVEPKVFSTFMWGAIICLAYRCRGKQVLQHPFLFLFGIALLLNHAYTSLGILIVGTLFWFFRVGRRTVVRFIGVVGLLFSLIYVVSLIEANLGSFDFFGHRISTFFNYAIRGLDGSDMSFSPLGEGWKEQDKTADFIDSLRIPTLVNNALHYGLIGAALFITFYWYCIKVCIEGRALTTDTATKLVFVLIPTLHLVYLGFFMPEPITPLHAFFFVLAVRLCAEIEQEKRLELRSS